MPAEFDPTTSGFKVVDSLAGLPEFEQREQAGSDYTSNFALLEADLDETRRLCSGDDLKYSYHDTQVRFGENDLLPRRVLLMEEKHIPGGRVTRVIINDRVSFDSRQTLLNVLDIVVSRRMESIACRKSSLILMDDKIDLGHRFQHSSGPVLSTDDEILTVEESPNYDCPIPTGRLPEIVRIGKWARRRHQMQLIRQTRLVRDLREVLATLSEDTWHPDVNWLNPARNQGI